jgi:hypothetical protein
MLQLNAIATLFPHAGSGGAMSPGQPSPTADAQ